MKYLLKFSYDGSNYYGFQKQPNKNTIQEQLEEALKKVNNNIATPIVATGRTDAGVHALAQYGHVVLNIDITPKKLKRALNSNLPEDIHIIEAKEVANDFHARYNVKSKEYQYIINIGEYNPLERNYVFQYNHELNLNKMKEALKYFLGQHDFRAFVTENKEKENCVRTITKATIKTIDNKIYLNFKGDGFLKHQVRNMVGLLIRIGENKIEPKEIINILESKDRSKTGKTAKACGLYLINVEYN